jgi:hypothetical protein
MSLIRYDAPPTIGRFMHSNLLMRGLMGPFGSGKSVGCCVELLRRSTEQAPDQDRVRRTRWAIIRNTYPELRDTTRATFEEWMPGGKLASNWLEQAFTFTLRMPMPDGTQVEAEFLFRALDRPDDVKKLLSLELTGAWVNEAREVPYKVVKMLSGRVGRFPSMKDGGPTWHGILMDTNPPDDDSWWYKLFEEQKPANAALFKQPGGTEPKAENIGHWETPQGHCVGFYKNEPRAGARWVPHLVPGYYENLLILNANDPLWTKVHVHAQYGPTMSGKPIYPEFRDALHVVEPSSIPNIPGAPLLLGMDFGLTPAMVFAQRDPRDQQLQIMDELVAEDLGALRFAEDAARYIKLMWPGRRVRGTGDPAGDIRAQTDEKTPYDIVNAQGVPLSPAHTNDFILRRESVARPLTRLTILGRPALVISSKCKILRKAMNGGYSFRRVAASGEDRFRDVPDKNEFSHVAEALQYLALGEGEDAGVLDSVTPEERRHYHKPKVNMAGIRRRRRA